MLKKYFIEIYLQLKCYTYTIKIDFWYLNKPNAYRSYEWLLGSLLDQTPSTFHRCFLTPLFFALLFLSLDLLWAWFVPRKYSMYVTLDIESSLLRHSKTVQMLAFLEMEGVQELLYDSISLFVSPKSPWRTSQWWFHVSILNRGLLRPVLVDKPI